MKFKVNRIWWIWALIILLHVLATGFFKLGVTPVVLAILLIDIALVLPEIHLSYDITNRQFTIKRVIYPDISFPCDKITAIEDATVMTFRGFGAKIYEESLGAYKITYTLNSRSRRRKAVVISVKNRTAFIRELGMYADKSTVLTANSESAFKKKKDDI